MLDHGARRDSVAIVWTKDVFFTKDEVELGIAKRGRLVAG
jgi:hypothetical protein